MAPKSLKKEIQHEETISRSDNFRIDPGFYGGMQQGSS
jgi:hypothetical protein